MVEIRTAERPAPGRPTEDRIFTTKNAAVLLDGVTSTRPPARNGAWYAQTLGEQLTKQLTTTDNDTYSESTPLTDLLATAITTVNKNHGLTPADSPATTVAIVRWTTDKIDVLVLADSPVITFGTTTTVIADTRIAALRPTTTNILAWKNRPGGYWVAEADPEAAHQAITTTLPRNSVEKVILATDGVSCGVDDYKIFPTWQSVLDQITKNGPEAVLDRVRAAELSDPTHTKWPRHKTHDDQALALIDFTK
jgi:hypothetical protein